LANLNHKVDRGTIANVLKRNGIEPAPERSRRTPWSTFLQAHWKVLAASDFLTVEVWTAKGLVTHYLLFVISLCDRVVEIAGITTRPDEGCMLQMARNLTDSDDGALRAKEYLIIDRDSKYSEQFRRLIGDTGTKVIRLPPGSPNLNAYAERFVRSIKGECLDRMIFVGQFATEPLAIPNAAAIWALGNAHSCLRRRTSRIRRMVIRLAGTAGSLNKRERAYPAEGSNYHALQRRQRDPDPDFRAS
jgi:putative transposase